MQTKKKHFWGNLTKRQKRNRITVYSILAIFYACGVLSFFMKLWPLGIILALIPSVALYVLSQIPKYIINKKCEEAEREYQLHKNDKNPDRIYLTGQQMYDFIHGKVIDLDDGVTKPFSYETLMKAKKRREQEDK